MAKSLRISSLDDVFALAAPQTTQTNPSPQLITVGTKVKTLSRLDNSENTITLVENKTHLLENTQQNILTRLSNLESGSGDVNKAMAVYDSSDGTFKDVKRITINEALGAKKVWDVYSQTYKSIDLINVSNAQNAQTSNFANQAQVALNVMYQGSGQTMENILVNYVKDIRATLNNLIGRVEALERQLNNKGGSDEN